MLPPPKLRSSQVTLSLSGIELLLDASGALIWPEQRMAIIADLHLEKASAYAERGVPLPPYDTLTTLERLEAVIAAHDIAQVVCLGDSFHDGGAGARIAPCDADRLRRLTAAHDWIWIAGNHDPEPVEGLGGRVVEEEWALGPLTFRHIAARETGEGEISGHFHPKASLVVRGRRLSGRCFLHDRRRLVLPAFGAFAGGLDARAGAFTSLFPSGFDTHLIARERLTTLPRGWHRPRA